MREIDIQILELFLQLTEDEKRDALEFGREIISRDEHQQGDQE